VFEKEFGIGLKLKGTSRTSVYKLFGPNLTREIDVDCRKRFITKTRFWTALMKKMCMSILRG
jgi:hypothetical protein